MLEIVGTAFTLCVLLAAVWGPPPLPPAYRELLRLLGLPGGFQDGVLQIALPGSLHVAVDGLAVPAELGFTGWLALTAAPGGKHVLMGELALAEGEVNGVASALLENGLQVTALGNRFLREQPRVVFLNLRGYGEPPDLARALKPALGLVNRAPATRPPRAAALSGPLDTARLAAIAGREGEQAGPVYRITAPRDSLRVTDMGARIAARMGLASRAAFYGGDADALVAGQVAIQAMETDAVLKALRRHGLELAALYPHTTAAHPPVWFAHFQGRGPAAKLAAGFRAALDELGRPLRVSPLGR